MECKCVGRERKERFLNIDRFSTGGGRTKRKLDAKKRRPLIGRRKKYWEEKHRRGGTGPSKDTLLGGSRNPGKTNPAGGGKIPGLFLGSCTDKKTQGGGKIGLGLTPRQKREIKRHMGPRIQRDHEISGEKTPVGGELLGKGGQ